jgi:putative inorganic carbon (hco3(-)) transporter
VVTGVLSGGRTAPVWPVVLGLVGALVIGTATSQRAVLTLAVLAVGAAVVGLVLNVELAVLAFVAIEPFEGYLKTITASGVKLFGGLVVAAWLLRVLSRDRPVQLAHPVIRAAAAFFALLLAAAVLHPNGAAGSEVLTRYLSYLGVLVVLLDCTRDRLAPRRVAAVFVASCAIAAAVGLIIFFGGELRATGPISDPNDFAFYLLAALPLALGLRSRAARPGWYLLAAVIIAAGMLATLSRGAITGVAAMVVFAVLAGILPGRRLLAGLLAVGVIVAAIAVISPGKISVSLAAKDKVAQHNVDERLVLWQAAGEMTADNPLLGLGPAGFRENYPRYVDYRTTDASHPIDVAHEMYLEAAAELGLPALAAFLALIGFGFAAARRAWLTGPDPGLPAGVLAGVVGTVVAAAFLTEQYYLPVWLLAALGAGLDPRPAVR